MAAGIITLGQHEALGVASGPSKAEAFWKGFLRSLADRRPRRVKLVISDDHEGLRSAGCKVFRATKQRCRVHWMRNALAHLGPQQRPAVVAMLKTIFAQESAELPTSSGATSLIENAFCRLKDFRRIAA